jgi:hypothetical protein
VGPEALVPFVLIYGMALFLFLIVRSFQPAARPFALPTLLAAIGFAIFLDSRNGHDPGFLWSALIAWFGLSATILGAIAHVIRVFVSPPGRNGSAS